MNIPKAEELREKRKAHFAEIEAKRVKNAEEVIEAAFKNITVTDNSVYINIYIPNSVVEELEKLGYEVKAHIGPSTTNHTIKW